MTEMFGKQGQWLEQTESEAMGRWDQEVNVEKLFYISYSKDLRFYCEMGHHQRVLRRVT